MKQKHRMIWERENGPVGSKGKSKDGDVVADDAVSVLRRYRSHINLPKELKF